MATAESRPPKRIDLEQFARLPEEKRYKVEVVRGWLVREPRPAPLHSRVQVRLASVLDGWQRAAAGRGAVLLETEFVLSVEPLTVRVPDVAWVSAGRVPPNGYAVPRWHFAPDVAAEVLSPRNRRAQVEELVADYLQAGSRLVWVADPRTRTVVAHRPGVHPKLLDITDRLTGDDVLSAFAVPVSDLFPD